MFQFNGSKSKAMSSMYRKGELANGLGNGRTRLEGSFHFTSSKVISFRVIQSSTVIQKHASADQKRVSPISVKFDLQLLLRYVLFGAPLKIFFPISLSSLVK